jgi:hypothetical protein
MKMDNPAYGTAFGGRARTFLVPSPNEPRISCSRAQISVLKWSLEFALPSSFSGYHYKQERGGEMFSRVHFL